MKIGQKVYPKPLRNLPKEVVFTGTIDENGYYLFNSESGFNWALLPESFNENYFNPNLT